jgi:hypothetical protein
MENLMTRVRIRPTLPLLILFVVFLASLGLFAIRASARTEPPAPIQAPAAQTQATDNATCLSCHANPGQTLTLPSGEELYVTIDPAVYEASVHGDRGYACVQCHVDIKGFPHDPVTAETRRDYSLEKYPICASCHQEPFNQTQVSAHHRALEAGNKEAAVCTDCHGAHGVVPLDEPRSLIPKTCERCHSEIYALYEDSVHGEALLGEGNPDVPSCTDCHGVHNVEGPSTTGFRLFSPEICARCHADEELMAKYGINTDVFETYVSDFHGTTVELFQAVAPGQETNKPVCIDCHGVHNIARADEPGSTVIKENILSTCQRCHPGATTNFPGAWLSHYRPSPQHNPLVYYVQTFYRFFIPTVIGGMLLFVLADSRRRFLNRREKTNE